MPEMKSLAACLILMILGSACREQSNENRPEPEPVGLGVADSVATDSVPEAEEEYAFVLTEDNAIDFFFEYQQDLKANRVRMRTSMGDFTIELYDNVPYHKANFIYLARQRYFDSTMFHRVVPNFVVQGGDPRGDGYGGPGYMIRDEINRLRYERGRVGMALAGRHTGGSQFFITLSPQPHLDGGYTIFGRVVAGDEVLDRIVQGDVIEEAREIAAAVD